MALRWMMPMWARKGFAVVKKVSMNDASDYHVERRLKGLQV
jgi:hypothetical protein